MANDLMYTKMEERVDWAIEMLKRKIQKYNMQVSDETIFHEACEVGRTLLVRSEIQYSNRGQ